MHRAIAVSLAMVLIPEAHAEVSDKMPTIAELWIQGAIIGAALFFAARWKVWLAVISLTVAVLLAYGAYDLVNDPYIGPAIRAEQGARYVAAAYGSGIIPVGAVILGLCLAYRRKHVEVSKGDA